MLLLRDVQVRQLQPPLDVRLPDGDVLDKGVRGGGELPPAAEEGNLRRAGAGRRQQGRCEEEAWGDAAKALQLAGAAWYSRRAAAAQPPPLPFDTVPSSPSPPLSSHLISSLLSSPPIPLPCLALVRGLAVGHLLNERVVVLQGGVPLALRLEQHPPELAWGGSDGIGMEDW